MIIYKPKIKNLNNRDTIIYKPKIKNLNNHDMIIYKPKIKNLNNRDTIMYINLRLKTSTIKNLRLKT